MYSQRITRSNPSLYVFLIDQSGSMSQQTASWWTLADEVCKLVNKYIDEMVVKSTTWDTVKDHFFISVIWYGSASWVWYSFAWNLANKDIIPLSEIAENPLRLISDATGKYPIRFEPKSESQTPMTEAFALAKETVEKFITHFPDSFPPIVINITDGESTDGSPVTIAKEIMNLNTNDGSVLIFNAHITWNNEDAIEYPSNIQQLSNDTNAKMLFEMTSEIPEKMISMAKWIEIYLNEWQKGYIYNGSIHNLHKFLDIGSVVTNSWNKDIQ